MVQAEIAQAKAGFLRSWIGKAASNRAVLYSALSSMWSVFAGAAILLLVTRYTSADEQGYYYTFGAFLTAQMFIDCGLGIVLAQFVSHETPHLDDAHSPRAALSRQRLGHLIRVGLLGYAGGALAFLALVAGCGGVFFSVLGDQQVAWQSPWVCACLATSAAMAIQPLSSILEGAGRVAANQSALLLGNVLGYTAGMAAIVLGYGLYAPALIIGLRTAGAAAGRCGVTDHRNPGAEA